MARRKNRKWAQIIDDAINILETEKINFSNFKSVLGVNTPMLQKVIQELEERELIETIEKISRAHKPCTYYYIPKTAKR